jgi:hypothetical protein
MTETPTLRLSQFPDSVRYIDLCYTLRGGQTGLCYKGYVQLGEMTETAIADDAHKASINRWIRNVYCVLDPTPTLVVDWNIPIDQQLVLLEFTTRALLHFSVR